MTTSGTACLPLHGFQAQSALMTWSGLAGWWGAGQRQRLCNCCRPAGLLRVNVRVRGVYRASRLSPVQIDSVGEEFPLPDRRSLAFSRQANHSDSVEENAGQRPAEPVL